MPADHPPDDDRWGDVHFDVDEPAAGGFEELPTRERPAPRRRVLIVVAAAVVGLGLIAALVARVVTATSDSADGRTTVTVTPSASSTQPPPSPSRSFGEVPFSAPRELDFLGELTRAEIAAAHAECPRLAQTCTTTGEVPSDVRQALRARFPKAKDLVSVSDIAYSATSGPRLAYRRVSARAGDLQITVEVRQAPNGDLDGGIRLTTAGGATVRVQRVVGGYVVEAQLSTPHLRVPDAGGLSALIRDRRLLATG